MRDTRADTLPLPPACERLARLVEDELSRFLAERRAEAAREAPGVEEVFDELERVIGSGGKRLRPIFCCLGHRAAGGEVGPELVRAAAALELLHTFAIIHDDVMDGSAVRRGRPASWAHLAERHRREGLPGDAGAFGVSAAILAGDLALILADRALWASGFPSERLSRALGRYNRMRTEVVAGQFLDVAAAHRGAAGEAEARRIASLKSGGYTVEGPLQIGALLAGAPRALLAMLGRYGRPLGEAFQLRDDLLGVFGDPAVTGKDRDSDLREGKRTFLVARALASASPGDRAFLEGALGRPDLTPEEIERARAVLDATGARAAAEALIDDLAREARAALDPGLLPGDVLDLLAELVASLTVRAA